MNSAGGSYPCRTARSPCPLPLITFFDAKRAFANLPQWLPDATKIGYKLATIDRMIGCTTVMEGQFAPMLVRFERRLESCSRCFQNENRPSRQEVTRTCRPRVPRSARTLKHSGKRDHWTSRHTSFAASDPVVISVLGASSPR